MLNDLFFEGLIEDRRDFHRYPELGWLELRTTAIVAERLESLGFSINMGFDIHNKYELMDYPTPDVIRATYHHLVDSGFNSTYLPRLLSEPTGVIGEFDTGREGPVVAIRFDMDALAISEELSTLHKPYREGFYSLNQQVSHACGHDGHTAMGLALAKLINENQESLIGKVRLIFQPAEEGVRGAKSMVTSKWVKGIDYLIGGHLVVGLPTGNIIPGMEGFLSTDKYNIRFIGNSSHAGSLPEEGNNALLAAATAVLNLHAIPRHSNGATRINVGKLNAGTTRNAVCEEAYLEIETRGETEQTNQYIVSRLQTIIRSAASMHHCRVEINHVGSAQSGSCSYELVERVREIVENTSDLSVCSAQHVLGSEDFTYFMTHVKATGGKVVYLGIGAGENNGYLPHSPNFDFDENALLVGVNLFYDILQSMK